MPMIFCSVCSRESFSFLGGSNARCTDHSDWPPKAIREGKIFGQPGYKGPRTSIEIIIPAYKPEERVTGKAETKAIKSKPSTGILFPVDSPIFKELGIEPINVDQALLKCSFCLNPVERVKATFGITKPRKIITLELIREEGKIVSFDDKISHLADKVVACPNCIGMIKPITNKFGEIISQGIKFPDFD